MRTGEQGKRLSASTLLATWRAQNDRLADQLAAWHVAPDQHDYNAPVTGERAVFQHGSQHKSA